MSRHAEDLVGVPLMLEPVLAEDLALAEPCAPGGGVVAIPSASSLAVGSVFGSFHGFGARPEPGWHPPAQAARQAQGAPSPAQRAAPPHPKTPSGSAEISKYVAICQTGWESGRFLRSGNGSWVGEWEVGEL